MITFKKFTGMVGEINGECDGVCACAQGNCRDAALTAELRNFASETTGTPDMDLVSALFTPVSDVLDLHMGAIIAAQDAATRKQALRTAHQQLRLSLPTPQDLPTVYPHG
jgi:hypothetical protein